MHTTCSSGKEGEERSPTSRALRPAIAAAAAAVGARAAALVLARLRIAAAAGGEPRRCLAWAVRVGGLYWHSPGER
jgi:hypothetical protein